MSLSVLAHLLSTERYRQRAAPLGGFSTPVMLEREVPEGLESILATNARGSFMPTRRNQEGVARYGFFVCPLEREEDVLLRLFETVWSMSLSGSWGNRFSSVAEAVAAMRATSLPPKTIIIPSSSASALCGQELPAGRITVVDGVQVVTSSLPEGSAIVATIPAALGVYTRVGDHLGLQLYNLQQTLMVVRSNDGMG